MWKWVHCCAAVTCGAVYAAVLSIPPGSVWLTGVRLVMASQAAVCIRCAGTGRDEGGGEESRRASLSFYFRLSSSWHAASPLYCLSASADDWQRNCSATDRSTSRLLLCLCTVCTWKAYASVNTWKNAPAAAAALWDWHILTVMTRLLSTPSSLSIQDGTMAPAASSLAFPLYSHWLPRLWPSECWALSKNLISQMEKQHLLSYSFTYGGHSCSYELKQVSRVGGLAHGDLEQRAWPWGRCWATLQLGPRCPEPDEPAYEMRPQQRELGTMKMTQTRGCRSSNVYWNGFLCPLSPTVKSSKRIYFRIQTLAMNLHFHLW